MRGAAIGAATIVFAIAMACGEDRPPCYRGDFIGCSCASGAYGYSACTADELGYGACLCDGTIPGLDAGPRDAAVETTKLALFAPCAADAECESTMCFEYGDGRKLCTKPCTAATAATDCPAPSTGCTGKGTCKPP